MRSCFIRICLFIIIIIIIYQHSLTLFTHLSIKFRFLFVCVAASKGAGNDNWVWRCSSASSIPSQLRHLRDVLSASFKSKLSLLSASLSGRLCKDFSGDTLFDETLLLFNCSQLCVVIGVALFREWRLRRGLIGGSVCMDGSSQSALSLPRLSQDAIRW